MSNELIKARIMTVMRNLPPLPQVTRQLMTVLGNEGSSAEDVAKVLSSDQALAGKVLKLVNSSFYAVPKEVSTISRAVVILGFKGIRNLALGLGSVEALTKLGNGLDMKDFWVHALANGAAAQSLAPHLKAPVDPEEAFIAGLLHDIGAYVLAAAVPDIYGPIVTDGQADRLQREADEIGLTHAQVGRGLLEFWELPESFCDAAQHHHDIAKATDGTRPLTNLVALADVLAGVHGGAVEYGTTEADLQGLIAAAELNLDHIRDALTGMDQKIQEMESFLQLTGGGSAGGAENLATRPTSCTVVSTEAERRDWAQVLLAHFGHTLFPMEDLLTEKPGSEDVGFVLIDTQSLTRQQMNSLLPFLAARPTRVAVMLEHGAHPPQGAEAFPILNIVFSRADLGRALATQPA